MPASLAMMAGQSAAAPLHTSPSSSGCALRSWQVVGEEGGRGLVLGVWLQWVFQQDAG